MSWLLEFDVNICVTEWQCIMLWYCICLSEGEEEEEEEEGDPNLICPALSPVLTVCHSNSLQDETCVRQIFLQ